MARVSVTLYYVRASAHGGAYGWGPFKTQADAAAALGMVGTHPSLTAAPFIETETHEMEDSDAAKIHYHDGQFRGRGRRIV